MHFWMIQGAKKSGFGLFGLLERLDTAYCDSTKCFPTFGNITRSWRSMQRSQKCIFEWFKRPKKEFFSHFLEFGLLDRLDIAYCDRTKCFLTFGNVTRSWRIIQRSQKCIFEWSKEPKKKFLVIFWTLVCWIDLILHIKIFPEEDKSRTGSTSPDFYFS